MENPNRLWELLARKLAGEASEAELQELHQLLQNHPEAQLPAGILARMWQQETATDAETERSFRRIADRLARQHAAPNAPAIAREPNQRTRSTRRPVLSFPSINRHAMVQSYFRIAWRNLLRHKAFSLVNIAGLAIGMAAAMLILLWIQHELSFDRFHKNKDRIYQVYARAPFDGKLESWNTTPTLLAPVLQLNYPEVEATTRINHVGAFVFHAGEKHLESHGIIADSGFLDIFSFPLLQGNPHTALGSGRSLVLTETFARKLFGDAEALGQMVRIDSSASFMVTGIMKDLPHNTSFDFEYIVPWSYMKEVHWERPDWESTDIQTFVMLRPGTSEESANARFANIARSQAKNINYELFLHPMSRWHLWSAFENGKIAGGYIKTVRLFGVIAAFILLIACINYMNLSTARSVKRAREVGIRKVAGAGKHSLIGQFLGESILVAALAGVLALGIAWQSLGWFNQLTSRELSIPYDNAWFWLAVVAFIVLTGVLAGSYPAFYLSGFKPIRVLKGGFTAANTLVTPRKVMVVVQFTFAITLIICTIVVYRQIRHGQSRDAGFDRNNLAFVYVKGDIQKNYPAIRDALAGSGAITRVTRTNSPVTDVWNGDNSYEWPGKKPDQNGIGFIKYYTDNGFATTMGLTIVAGRDIDPAAHPADSTAILLNETAVKTMGLKNPVGQTIKSRDGSWQVAGVVKDFVPGLPFDRAYPTIIHGPGPGHWFGTMTFRLNRQHATSDNLARIGAILKQYNPDYPFEYYFTDRSYALKFGQEEQTGTLAALFAGLTIFISCLGLFALAAYMAENRIKEIGVRKVLGASVSAISTLLSKDFLKLVVIAFAIASPLAWWAMHSWLQNYEYRVPINWWVFALAGAGSLLIAVITVSYQAIKAALANPVKSLRSE
ncbi:MAG: ABC transporter permease [Chitinophagaceae bacterium]